MPGCIILADHRDLHLCCCLLRPFSWKRHNLAFTLLELFDARATGVARVAVGLAVSAADRFILLCADAPFRRFVCWPRWRMGWKRHNLAFALLELFDARATSVARVAVGLAVNAADWNVFFGADAPFRRRVCWPRWWGGWLCDARQDVYHRALPECIMAQRGPVVFAHAPNAFNLLTAVLNVLDERKRVRFAFTSRFWHRGWGARRAWQNGELDALPDVAFAVAPTAFNLLAAVLNDLDERGRV